MKVVSNTCTVWVCLGVLMCFLMYQCVRMPRIVSGKDVCNVEIHQGVDGWPQAYLLKVSIINNLPDNSLRG